MADYRLFLPVFLLIILSFGSVSGDAGGITVVAGKSFQINYDAKYVQVLGVQSNKEDQGLVFSIQATSQIATLEITLPRELIDATTKDGSDVKFIVLVDGTFTSYVEKRSSQTSRTILIQLAPENKELEIIGTHLASSESTSTTTQQTPVPTQSSQQENQTLQKQMQNAQSEQNPTSVEKPFEVPSEKSENTQNMSTQELSKMFHFNSSNLSFNPSGKQTIEYLVIASAILILIIVITSSKKTKAGKQIRK